jgi:hypothetical protein
MVNACNILSQLSVVEYPLKLVMLKMCKNKNGKNMNKMVSIVHQALPEKVVKTKQCAQNSRK